VKTKKELELYELAKKDVRIELLEEEIKKLKKRIRELEAEKAYNNKCLNEMR
jgi:hypothetical protein